MKRLLCLFWLLLALAPVALVAQSSRLSCAGASCSGTPAAAPAITITTPTLAGTHQATAASLLLAGTARNDVTRVEWSNDRGGSGIASGTFPSWSVEGSAGEPETVFEDTFTIETATDLVDHTPGPIGDEWTEVEDTLGNNFCKIHVSNDYVAGGAVTSTAKLICIATPASPVSGDHYTVSWRLPSAYSASSSVDSAIIFGYVDTDNYCALSIRSSVANPDLILMKRVAGVNTDLATGVNVGPVANHAYSLEVDGADLTVQLNGVTVLTATDSAGACDNSTDAGIGWGDIRLTGRAISTLAAFDDFKIVDEDNAASGITLQSGANVITAIAYCGETECGGSGNGRDSITVTLAVADTTDPVITITGPTTATVYQSPTAAFTVSGMASDNVALDDVTFTCAPGCTPASGTASLSGNGSWTFDVTITSGQAATIIATATDTSTNDAPDQFVASFESADTTDPSIALSSPTAGTTYTATATPTTFSGTASDDTALALVTCSNAAGGSTINAAGTTSWSCAVPIFSGTHTVTFTAFDLAGNFQTDTVDVTFSPALTITSGAALPAATEGQPYSFQLTAGGGTLPFTWSNDGAGTTVNDSDADCAAFTISSTGLVSVSTTVPVAGTRTCSFTSEVTDSAGSPANTTKNHTILISAVGTGQHDFFNAALLRPDYHRAYSLRPGDASHTSLTDPYYSKQLNAQNNGGFHATECDPASPDTDLKYRHDFAGDTDPHKQDAAKAAIPAFSRSGGCGGETLAVAIGASAAGTNEKLTLSDVTPNYNGKDYLFGTEIMKARLCSVAEGGPSPLRYRIDATNEICVTRGAYGTTPTTHAIGTVVKLVINQMYNYLKVPIGSVDGNTYLFIWDQYYTDSYTNADGHAGVGTWNTGQKTIQITNQSSNKMFEPKMRFDGNIPGVVGFNLGVDLGVAEARIYNSINTTGETTWSETDGKTMGPGPTSHNGLRPMAGTFIFKANTWQRWWLRVRQKENDFDDLSMWVADENNEPVLIFDEVPMSVGNSLAPVAQNMAFFWFALGDSNDNFLRGDLRDLVAYFRNLVVLKWTHAGEPADLAAEGLMVKPIGSGGGS